MSNEIFGWEFKKNKRKPKNLTPIKQEDTDGALIVNAGGINNYVTDLTNSSSENVLIQKYRNMAKNYEIDSAIDEIVNEFIDIDDDNMISISFIKEKIDEKYEQLFIDEFNEALRLLDFNNVCYDIIKRWYVDGRLKYHSIIDPNNSKNGIEELRYVDPRKLKRIKEIKATNNNLIKDEVVREYYIYNEKGFTNQQNNLYSDTSYQGISISIDSIIEVNSGIMDTNNLMVLSYLDKAIKPLNNLKTLEDASIIYTLVRAPERRVWYIDVGGLPNAKAEQHIRTQMNLHRSKLAYDPNTGEVVDSKKFMTMLEDYWLPRRGDQGRGTEVTTIPAGANFDKMSQIDYFKGNLYKSLNIPNNRLNNDDVFTLGRSSQITREEVKFSKFITKLRNKFNELFFSIIEKNLKLKGLITDEDWLLYKSYIKFNWISSNYHDELKKSEVLTDRVNILNIVEPYVGKYFSKEWVRKKILNQSDEEILEIDKQITYEAELDQMAKEVNDSLVNTNQNDNNNSSPEQNPNIMKNVRSKENDSISSDDMAKEQLKDKIFKARTIFNLLKDKDRNPREQSIFKSAAQILARNKADKDTKNTSNKTAMRISKPKLEIYK